MEVLFQFNFIVPACIPYCQKSFTKFLKFQILKSKAILWRPGPMPSEVKLDLIGWWAGGIGAVQCISVGLADQEDCLLLKKR